MGENKIQITSYLNEIFDSEIKEVSKNNQLIPFSAEKILTDLILGGVSSFDALNALQEIQPHLVRGMKTEKITQLLYKSLSKGGYKETEILLATFQQPITIAYPEEDRAFSFREMKAFVSQSLKQFVYSSSIHRAVVNELSRIVMTIRSSKLQSETIEKMMPAVLRNTIGVNPFSSKRCIDDYQKAIRINKSMEKLWSLLPEAEKPSMYLNFHEASFRVILLSYEYLPGITLGNTFHQIEKLVTELSTSPDNVLSDKEVYVFGKMAKQVKDIANHPAKMGTVSKTDLIATMRIIMHVIHGLMNRGAIQWIVITNLNGIELYSKFSSAQSKRANRSLIAMAISGLQSIMNEITDKNVSQIEHQEGSVIRIDRRKTFSVLSLVSQSSHLVKQRLNELANFIENKLTDEIIHFTGNVNIFNQQIGRFVEEKIVLLMD